MAGNNPTEKLQNIQQSFKLRLSSRIEEIKSCWKALEQSASPDFTNLHLLLHSLVGTSGTYSAIMVSNVTRKIEVIVKRLLNKDILLTADIAKQIDQLFMDLHAVADIWQPSNIPFIPEKPDHYFSQESNWVSNIYLVEDDEEIAIPLIDFLNIQGYRVFYYKNIHDFEKKYTDNEKASAIIMDMAFKEGHIAGAESIKQLSEHDDEFPPVIFISVHNDIEARMAAVKAGAKRYFTKPINYNNLLNSLDSLTNRFIPEAYRILLIDDEQDELDFYTGILQQHGFETLAYTNPLDTYAAIEAFQADIIVLDLYMPECSGLELARVIRQNDDYAHIPIVFLSAELDTGTQMSALDLGGDDFLMKPVDPSHFVQALIARVKRSRRMNSLNKALHETLREKEFHLITLDQHAIVCMTDMNGKIIHVNEHLEKISGYKAHELLGSSYEIFKAHPPEELWEQLNSGKVWNGLLCNTAKDESKFWLELTMVPFIDSDGHPYKYVFVGTDVTRLKETEVELILAKETAERTNDAKTSFLSGISHELRTPMNAICGFAQLLKSNADDLNKLQLDYIDEILNASDHLLTLINDTLNLSKIESGKVDISIERVNISEIILNSLSLISVMVDQKKLKVLFQVDGIFVSLDEFYEIGIFINVDPVRIKQVILNLLTNAVKYNSDRGTIIIGYINMDDNKLRINITDTGKGIASHLLPQLFTEFNRLGKEQSEIEGTGIGLMISRNLVEIMNGKIGVESEEGKGSTFWLEFRKAD